jgi:hypothetical protein
MYTPEEVSRALGLITKLYHCEYIANALPQMDYQADGYVYGEVHKALHRACEVLLQNVGVEKWQEAADEWVGNMVESLSGLSANVEEVKSVAPEAEIVITARRKLHWDEV